MAKRRRRGKKTALERRQQLQRSHARVLAHLLQACVQVHLHRGSRLSRVGTLLMAALRQEAEEHGVCSDGPGAAEHDEVELQLHTRELELTESIHVAPGGTHAEGDGSLFVDDPVQMQLHMQEPTLPKWVRAELVSEVSEEARAVGAPSFPRFAPEPVEAMAEVPAGKKAKKKKKPKHSQLAAEADEDVFAEAIAKADGERAELWGILASCNVPCGRPECARFGQRLPAIDAVSGTLCLRCYESLTMQPALCCDGPACDVAVCGKCATDYKRGEG